MVFQFGGGCHGHPDGTEAGAKAIRQAIEATLEEISLLDYAKNKPELRKAIEKWGK
jgi:ribulose-bisphosphate carboxylase large chain